MKNLGRTTRIPKPRLHKKTSGAPLPGYPERAPDIATVERHLVETLEQSRDAVRRAHERCEAAVQKASRIREELRRLKRRPRTVNEAASSAFALATEESGRSVREKDRFLAVVSHELRQPLNAALAALALMERTAPQTDQKPWVVLHRQLEQMARLLDDLLDMSRLALNAIALRLERIDLRQTIDSAAETITPQLTQKGHAFTAALGDDPAWVVADPTRLHQVFANLLSNAVRYTPVGGQIAVSVQDRVDSVVVEIADSGYGIPAAELTNIFEPFVRGGDRSPEGFGIGLALVKGIVELHGGGVDARSAGRDCGSVFTVSLPRLPADRAPAQQ